ncbi:MAG TPA: MFS transporter, partial [Polyangia bacterium]|nr:MFS transporter [Polyangia bacterium]
MNAPDVNDRIRRRALVRIVPYLLLLYFIAYLDRVNISYAALEMRRALPLTDTQYGFGAGIFFAGYFLFEIPGTLLVETWSARGWIARILIGWGLVACAMAFVKTPSQFYWLRFFLGAAEAGFFPGVLVYLSHWFRAEDRARAFALFMLAVPMSNVIGAPVSGLLLGAHWGGMAGWRWLFLLEGMPAIVLGVATIFLLTDRPSQARWLTDEERQHLEAELAREAAATPTPPGWRAFVRAVARRE